MTRANSDRHSSGCWRCFPLSAATNSGSRPGVALPPASPLPRVCPLRRGGSFGSFGRRASSTSTLNTGLGTDGPQLTTLCGEEAGSFLPVPGDPSGRRRRIYTCHIVDVVCLVYAIRTYFFPTLGRGPGFHLGPAYPRPGP